MHCGLGWWGGAAAANGEIFGILYVYALNMAARTGPRRRTRLLSQMCLLLIERNYAVMAARLASCASRPVLTRDDLVVAVSTGSFRHGAIAAHRRTWLRGTRTFVLSDSALPNTSLHQSGVQGSSCNGVDRFASALHRANATFAGFKWLAFVEDDVYGYIDNLLRTLSARQRHGIAPRPVDAVESDDSLQQRRGRSIAASCLV